MIGESLQSVSKLEALEKACKIWFNAPEGRAARELRALTTPERERVWADMTGNKDISTFNVKDDNHVQIGKALASLQTEMVEFASKHPSRALSMAIRTSPGYVCDPQFLFKFLLSKSFSVRSTMALLASHFEMKRELFGEETLGRDIALSDMNEDDISFLRNGFYRFLGGTDSAGRLVAFLVFSDNSDIYSGNSSMCRGVFYWNMVASEQESAQRLGIVRVAYFHDTYPDGGPNNELLRTLSRVIEAVPIRSNALYMVCGSNLWANTIELLLLLLSPFVRLRTRLIKGSYYEKNYSLMCLGIPMDYMPLLEDGSLDTEEIERWIAARRAKEN